MKIHLETERLIIREIELTDVDDFYEMDADPEVHKYIDQTPVTSKEEMVKVIEMLQKQYAENGIARWAVTDKVSGEMIGWCGLKFFREPLNGLENIYEHGYRFKQKHWGKGYATESSKAIIDWGFKNLKADAFYAMTHPENENSMQVLRKIGFEFQGFFDLKYGDFEIEKCTWFKLEKINFQS